MIKKLKEKAKSLRFKVVNCPSCLQQCRVPVKPGRILLITCPKCEAQFKISFINPMSELFQWNKGLGLLGNIKASYQRVKALPNQGRFSVVVFLFAILFFLFSLFILVKPIPDPPADWQNRQIQEQALPDTFIDG